MKLHVNVMTPRVKDMNRPLSSSVSAVRSELLKRMTRRTVV